MSLNSSPVNLLNPIKDVVKCKSTFYVKIKHDTEDGKQNEKYSPIKKQFELESDSFYKHW